MYPVHQSNPRQVEKSLLFFGILVQRDLRNVTLTPGQNPAPVLCRKET
jgi:hypothetical protein